MDKGQRWIIFAVVLGSSVIFLDTTVVNVALETIGTELPRTLFGKLEAQTYVYAAYLLSLSALLIPAGAASDIFGRKRIFFWGLGALALTSFFCAVAPSMELLILARILLGAAGALVVPGALAIITAEFQGEARGRVFGIWAGSSAAATIAGPLVGGLVIQLVSWRAAFYVNVPLLLIAMYATGRYVPESGRGELGWDAMDWRGAAIAVVALGGLVFGAIRGGQNGWRDPAALTASITGALAVVAFPLWMKKSPHPLIPLDLFHSRNFFVTNMSTVLIYGGIYAVHLYFPLFLQGTIGYDPAAAGLSTMPGWVLLALFSAKFGKLAVRYGPRLFMAAGPVLMGLGTLWFTRVSSGADSWVISADGLIPPRDYVIDILPGWLLFGIGLVIMVAPLTTALMNSVPPVHAGVASAINNAISRVGPQIAGAVIFVAITAAFYGSLGESRPGLEIDSRSFRNAVSPLNRPDKQIAVSLEPLIEESSTKAFRMAMIISAGLLLAGAVVNAVGINNAELITVAVQSPDGPVPT